jgi:hypothetical protein
VVLVIVRGTISNGGWTAREGHELLVRIAVDEMTDAELSAPSALRGRTAVLVLGPPPALPDGFYQLSQPEAATPAHGDDALSVDAGTTPPTVVERERQDA